MNKKILLVLFLTFGIFFGSRASEDVNLAIKESFQIKFGTSTAVEWKKIADVYVGYFEYEGRTMNAYYSENGELIATGKYLDISSISNKIISAIGKRYEGWFIQQAYEFTLDASSPSSNLLITLKNEKFTAVIEINQNGRMGMIRKNKNRPQEVARKQSGFFQQKLTANSNVGSQQVVKTIELSKGVSLEYIEQGDSDGIPVVFLHGYTDSWRSYESLLQLLPGNVHAFAVTQRGHGNSSRPSEGYNPVDFSNDIAAFIRKLNLGPVFLVGHSMGGTITQRFALDHPEMLKGIVLAGSLASFTNNEAVGALHQMVSALKDTVDWDFAYEFQKGTIAKPIPAQSLAIYVYESMRVPPGVWKSVLNELVKIDYTGEFKKINKPTLILWGDKDNVAFRQDQDILHRSITSSKLIVYKGVGHGMHWEEPARFANDLVEFIYSTK